MTTVSDPEISLDLSRALQDAQKGDQTAWETLFRECYPKVRRVVRRKLDRSMRSLYDSTDFASDVMKSLAANIDQLSFPSIDSLMRFLAHVAEQKVIDEYRRRHTLKRDVDRERRFAAATRTPARFNSPPTSPPPASSPRPTKSTSGCWTARTRPSGTIINLKQQGYSTADIADTTGWNIRKVQRFLKDLHDALHDSGD